MQDDELEFGTWPVGHIIFFGSVGIFGCAAGPSEKERILSWLIFLKIRNHEWTRQFCIIFGKFASELDILKSAFRDLVGVYTGRVRNRQPQNMPFKMCSWIFDILEVFGPMCL